MKVYSEKGINVFEPECFMVQFPYKSVVATPADDRAPARPLLNVEARIDEHDSS